MICVHPVPGLPQHTGHSRVVVPPEYHLQQEFDFRAWGLSSLQGLRYMSYSQYFPYKSWTWVPIRKYIRDYTKLPGKSLCPPMLASPLQGLEIIKRPLGLETPVAPLGLQKRTLLKSLIQSRWPQPHNLTPRASHALLRQGFWNQLGTSSGLYSKCPVNPYATQVSN